MRNQFHNFSKSFQQAGLEVHRLVFQPLASALAVLHPHGERNGDYSGGYRRRDRGIAIFYGGSYALFRSSSSGRGEYYL